MLLSLNKILVVLGFSGLLHLVSGIQCNLDLVTLHIGTIGDLVAIIFCKT